jgi:predicted ribosomally synthesized peptide with SipW-like signal peptide
MRIRKRYLLAATVLVVVAVLAVGAATSGAWFTDVDVVENNTLGAATLDVDIRSEGGTAIPLAVANMQPGEWKPIGTVFQLGMYNMNTPASDIPCKYVISFQGIQDTGANLSDVLLVRVRHTFAGTANPAGWPVVYEGPFETFLIKSTVTPGIVGGGILNINNTHVYVFEFKIADAADNTYQGASTSFNLQLNAYQVADPVF